MTITMNELDYVRANVRQVPDFPKPGILFLDITTATKDVGKGDLEITPTGIKITEVTEKHDYDTVMESRTINISYLKDLETRLERIEKLHEEQLIK